MWVIDVDVALGYILKYEGTWTLKTHEYIEDN